MAWMSYQSGKAEQAELTCHQLIDVLPNYAEAWHLLGVIALRDGNIELAIKHLQKALALNSRNPMLYSNFGLALHEQGNLEKAQYNYRKAISINARYADAYYNLHALLLEKPDIIAAINCLQQLLTVNRRDLDARLMLGILLDRQRDSGAQEHLEAASKGSDILQARIDAWMYLKNQGGKDLPILGSNVGTFRLAMKAAKIEGLVLEFGVRHGNTLRQIAGLAEQKVHGFDSFEGLPEVWHHEPKGSYTTKGAIPVMPENVKLHVGWFEDTLPRFLETTDEAVRFINVDCDIYSSTKTVLELLASRITSGTVIVFDEYIGNEHWREDEFKAFQEAVKKYHWRYEYLSFSFFTKQVAIRIL